MKDNNRFSFSNRDFNWPKEHYMDSCLEKMLEIKALFTPEFISIKRGERVELVADSLGLNEEQEQLLQILFS